MTYLYRPSPREPLIPHQPEEHGYPCDYLGGDEGLPLVAEEFLLVHNLGERAVFLHLSTGTYHAAIRVGEPTASPIGDDWRQGQAHIVLPADVVATEQLVAMVGPFTFYNLLLALEAGPVTPREAIADGYFGEAVRSLRGRVRPLPCTTPEEAMRLLARLA